MKGERGLDVMILRRVGIIVDGRSKVIRRRTIRIIRTLCQKIVKTFKGAGAIMVLGWDSRFRRWSIHRGDWWNSKTRLTAY